MKTRKNANPLLVPCMFFLTIHYRSISSAVPSTTVPYGSNNTLPLNTLQHTRVTFRPDMYGSFLINPDPLCNLYAPTLSINIHEQIKNSYLCRNIEMDGEDEFEALLGALGAAAGDGEGEPPDECLLDQEDDEEVTILDPPLTPTPASSNVPSGSTEKDKVNVENMDTHSESDRQSYSSKSTNFTTFSTYSKYGIRESTVFTDSDPHAEPD